jgi:hypothetical protein
VGPEKHPTRPADEVGNLFERSLEVIHSALVSCYRLTEEEARGAEEDLRMWFQRLGRRGGSAHMPAKMLRLSLLSAACQYGRSFQLWKLGGRKSPDAGLNTVLAREPEEIATDLERRFYEERS